MVTTTCSSQENPPVMDNPEALMSMSSQPLQQLNSDFAPSEGTFDSLEKSYGAQGPISMKNRILTKLAQDRASLHQKSQYSDGSEVSLTSAVAASTINGSHIG